MKPAADPGREAVEALLALPPDETRRIIEEIGAAGAAMLRADWPAWVRAGQEPPNGDDWRVWLMMAGRGFGKTRAGAEYVSALARAHPGALIALVAASPDEARRVMVEGPSGLIAAARPGAEAEAMRWQPTLGRLVFASGAEAQCYSGAHADSLRGPEHHFAWCDEIAKWAQAQAAWDNLMLGLRAGARPRALVTTTPRPVAVLKAIVGSEATVRTGGATSDNPFLAACARADAERRYGGTRFGRQELEGELIEDVEGALWWPELIEARRAGAAAADGAQVPAMRAVFIGVDPPASVEGACGIVACGLGDDGIGYVLGDHSAAGLTPDGWARKVAAAAEAWDAYRIVVEVNNGGDMIAAVLRSAGVALPVKPARAVAGKSLRAAPVAALFECGKARFAGRFPELEAELRGLTLDGRYQGPGRSPDRADAMVWAMTEAMEAGRRHAPRIVQL